MSFTIQSASLPVVAANRCATMAPRTVTSSSSGSVSQLSTSGRLWTNRWSCSSRVYAVAEVFAGIHAEADVAELVARPARPPPVVPRADHEEVPVEGVVPLQQLVNPQRPVEVFLVPPAADVQCRHGDPVQVRPD